MRFTDFNGGAKVTAASTTVVFTGTDIPADGVVAYHVELTGAGMTFGDITRFRVKSGGQTIYDLDNAHFIAMVERWSPDNRLLAAANTRFTIPFWLPGIAAEDAADLCQMPRGAAPTVELVIGAGGAAGTAVIGWTRSTVTPKYFPTALGQTLNWAVGPALSQRYPIFEPGIIAGVSINTTGLTRLKVVQGGVQRFQMDSTLMIEAQSWYNALAQANPILLDLAGPDFLSGGLNAPAGNSYLEGDTDATWAAVTNEAVIHGRRPQAA